jgi:hypothetical protein
MLNQFCTSLDFTLNLMVYYGILQENDAQCFALEASITAGAYLMVPIVAGLALVNTFVVKAYIQYLREKSEEEQTASEDDKLRAFDRTTWDSRVEAMESIYDPPVLFTDTFRWVLRREDNGVNRPNHQHEVHSESKFDVTQTFLAEDSSSDEEHGARVPSLTELNSSSASVEGDKGKDDVDGVNPPGDQSLSGQQGAADMSSVSSGSYLLDGSERAEEES